MVTTMASEVVGREEELGRVRAFLDASAEDPRALVLEGEAGIGKSTIWLAGLEHARERGYRVLSSRPAEADQALAFAGLGDLLDGVLDDVLPLLAPPRRRALEVALLLVDEAQEPLDPRALGVAVRSALEHLAEAQPLVVAVDDVQWLDPSSAVALSFALRRLGGPLVLVLARRLAPAIEPSEIERAFGADHLERLEVGSLSAGAIQTLLRDRLDRVFPRPTLLRIHELSGGNPFYALELGRALPVDVDPTRPLPLPGALEELVRARLSALPDATRRALALGAAAGSPTDAALEAVGVTREVLEPALAARVIDRKGGATRFTHPLLASVLYQGLEDEERRHVHARLAGVAHDPLERARHLALSSDKPDDEIATVLDVAVTNAQGRGAIEAAAEIAEHALRLTPASALEGRNRRTIAAARAHLDAGDTRRARALALELPAVPTARARAEALVLLSDVESFAARLERAVELRREALAAASEDPALRAEIHLWLGNRAYGGKSVDAAHRHVRAALELAEQLEDNDLRVAALALLAHGRFRAGEPEGRRLVDETVELAAVASDPQRRRWALFSVVHAAVWSHDLDRARTLLADIDREWSGRDELARQQVLWWLGLVELHAGHFGLAAEMAERSREISLQYLIDDREEPTPLLVARVAAYRGELERARRLIESHTTQEAVIHAQTEAVLGLVDSWSGRPAAAVTRFARADMEMLTAGANEPAMSWWRADQAEALLELGRLDDAGAVTDSWELHAVRLGREALLAAVTRCRGLEAAARGVVDEAQAQLERAAAQHEAVGDPFGHARALLALGIVRRRARQKRAARAAIEEAVRLFDECEAKGWAATARSELGRIGGRRREEGLTAAEHRVATLVAEGRTNREVAAALFLGERTVETHLSHIYAKLGIRSRTELARKLSRAS